MLLKNVINGIAIWTTWQMLIAFSLMILGVIQILVCYIIVGAVKIGEFIK